MAPGGLQGLREDKPAREVVRAGPNASPEDLTGLCLSAYACGVTLPQARWSKLPGPPADRRCSLAIIIGARLRVDGGATTP
jgi:hypothetical protein